MNKQEAIKSILAMPFISIREEPNSMVRLPYVSQMGVLDMIRRLEEPPKVVIPWFVAEWILKIRDDGLGIGSLFDFSNWTYGDLKYQVSVWVSKGNGEKLARAWLDGYDVERRLRNEIIKIY